MRKSERRWRQTSERSWWKEGENWTPRRERKEDEKREVTGKTRPLHASKWD